MVALVTVVQSLPSVVLAPAFMAATERLRRRQLLVGVLIVRFRTVTAAGILLATNGPAAGPVLALLESLITAALAGGAVTASLLVDWLGPNGALLAAGGLEVALAVVSWPWIRKVDAAAVVPERELHLLRGVAFFRPLQLTTIEDLAGRLEDVRIAAGAEVVRQGEPGDCFCIVETGRLEALIDGSPVRELVRATPSGRSRCCVTRRGPPPSARRRMPRWCR